MAYLCPICGVEFVPYTRGKTKTYCSSECRNYSKYRTALQNSILSISPTSKASSLIRGDMFRLANLLSNGTNTFRAKFDKKGEV